SRSAVPDRGGGEPVGHQRCAVRRNPKPALRVACEIARLDDLLCLPKNCSGPGIKPAPSPVLPVTTTLPAIQQVTRPARQRVKRNGREDFVAAPVEARRGVASLSEQQHLFATGGESASHKLPFAAQHRTDRFTSGGVVHARYGKVGKSSLG